MISTRYIPIMCGLFALALIPTVIHSYVGDMTVDGRVTTAISYSLAEYRGTSSARSSTWGKRRFDSDDWIERTYTNAGRDEVSVTVVRSYDAKRLYHHPELAIAYGTDFVALQSQRLPARPDIPVHVLEPGPGVNARAMYVLHYDGHFVEHPIMFQILIAGELLFGKRKPMTIFFVLDPTAPREAIENLGASHVLFAAVDSFLEQKSAGAS